MVRQSDCHPGRLAGGYDPRVSSEETQATLEKVEPYSERTQSSAGDSPGEAITFGDKIERLWRNNVGPLLAGAIAGAGVGVSIGGVTGLFATFGTFSVPMAIVGGVVGAIAGAFLWVAVPRSLGVEVNRIADGFLPPGDSAVLRNQQERKVNNDLKSAVEHAFLRGGKSTDKARSWRQELLSWIKRSDNFSFGNVKYGRATGYRNISAYRQYITDVLNKDQGASLDVSCMSPGRLKTMPPGLLKGFSHIEQLIVERRCSVETLPQHMLSGLSQLRDLSLSGNRYDGDEYIGSSYVSLKTLLPHFFDAVPSLETLKLRNNDLTHLPEGVFNQLSQLKSLDLSGNEKLPLTKELAQGLSQLETLKLSGMGLKKVPKEFLQNLPNLKVLDLSHNDLSQLERDDFQGLHSLEELRIEGNKIAALPAELKSSVPNLKAIKVDLEKDPIKQIPEGVAELLLGTPACFPEFDKRYEDRLNPQELADYVEKCDAAERVDRLKLLQRPGVVDGSRTELDLNGLKNLTALPDMLGARQIDTLDLSGNENLAQLPDNLQVKALVLENCGPRDTDSGMGALGRMAADAEKGLSGSSLIGAKNRTLKLPDSTFKVYGSIDLEAPKPYTGLPKNLEEQYRQSQNWEQYYRPAKLIQNLHVNGSVLVARCKELTIPKGVKIQGDLSLHFVNSLAFESDLEVEGHIYVDQELKDKLEGGEVTIPEHLLGKIKVKEFK